MESSNLIQSEKESLILKFKLRIKRLLYIQYSPRYIRLKGDLQAYRENLLVMKGKNKSNENNWIDRALVLCEKVDNELKKIGIDEGWKLMHAAER
jgi:hypothetical protein